MRKVINLLLFLSFYYISHSQNKLFLVNDSADRLYEIDLSDNSITDIGPAGDSEALAPTDDFTHLFATGNGSDPLITVAVDGSGITTIGGDPAGDRGLAYNVYTKKLYGSNGTSFGTIDVLTGNFNSLDFPPGATDVEGLAADPINNMIYGLNNDGDLYLYNVALATWSTIGDTGENWNDCGLAFDVANNILYAVNSSGELYSINPSTAMITFLSDTGLGTGNDYGLAYQNDVPPIPTLSQWGIIALSIVMLIFGVVAVRQRQVKFN